MNTSSTLIPPKAFYTAKHTPLSMTEGLWSLWYFDNEQDAKDFACIVDGKVDQTSKQIWRVQVLEVQP